MQAYTEILPPTAVTHALSLPFVTAEATNLIVAKTSLLQVFSITSSDKLRLIGEYPLAGTVTGLARVKTLESSSRNTGEALLISFRDAKLSLVEWDRENHRLSTISIHYYEGENVVAPPFEQDLGEYESVLAVDPSSRCAALKFGARQLAILPIRQFGDELMGEEEGEFEGKAEKMEEGEDDSTAKTPYKASFVLPMTTLDPSLCHTVHLAFLYEYREPTFGILSSPMEPSAALFEERKDCLTYTVFTLDLEQKASTNLITVSKLPSSLWKVVPLPLPVGGALLVGNNELVHIDQSGKANATAVNEFARKESDFGMADQSHLNLKLEDCCIELLDPKTGELLVVLNDGSLATINFQMLGRAVSSVDVSKVSAENGGSIFPAAASCVTSLDNGKLFVGSEDGVSSLLGWTRPTPSLARKRSHAQMLGKDLEDEDDEDAIDEDDDDLYDAAPETKKRATSAADPSSADNLARFEVRDALNSIGPINKVCLGKRPDSSKDKLQLLAGTGRGRSSRLTCLNRDIVPRTIRKSQFDGAKNVWAIHSKQPDSEDGHDNLLFVYDGSDTQVYDITPASADEAGEGGYIGRSASEFEHEGETLEVGTLAGGASVVQIRKTEIRTYDAANLGLNQIIPMMDDDTDAEFGIVHTSFCDPYLLVIRDDSSILVLQVQGKEIEPLDNEGPVAEKKWLSGSVYSGPLTNDMPVLFLLSADGVVSMFSLPDLKPLCDLPGIPHLPAVLSWERGKDRRAGIKETLTELLVADLGMGDVTSSYLLIRTALDDVVLYEPFLHRDGQSGKTGWYHGLRFRKVPVPYVPKYNDAEPATKEAEEEANSRQPALKCIRLGEYIAVTIPGSPPSVLLKEGTSPPKILEICQNAKLSGSTPALAPLNRIDCQHGFATLTSSGGLIEQTLPENTWFGTGWSVRQNELEVNGEMEEVRQLAYHKEKGVWVVGTCRKVDFWFAKEDGRHAEQDDINLRPQVPQYSIHILSATSHRILHTYPFPFLETLTDLKVLDLEATEVTHDHKPLVVASTASQRGEDMPARGAVIVFDIIDVVPDPDIPESNHKLHVLAREESRGAITALAQFPGGLAGTAQGLKLMIRGMREDGSCLPVAFLDAQCHTTVLKTLDGKGLWLAGDAWKGLWFGGFTEEPYKLTILGKSTLTTGMEVLSAEFLPFDGGLYLLVWDAEEDMHVLQYDPENPVTSGGMRLLHRSTFHVGHFPTGSLLLPSTLAPFTEQARDLPEHDGEETKQEQTNSPLYHVLTTSLSGALGLVTPLDESTYRRLGALQGLLTSVLEHSAGLNPRAYRSGGGVEGAEVLGAKGVVDGALIRRIAELGVARRAEVLGRAGGDGWGLRSDLEVLGGGGLGFLWGVYDY